MIFDQLSDCEPYKKLSENFAAGMDYLQATAFETVADGDYPIIGQDVFARVQSYQTKLLEQGKWEAHRHYADIQYMVSGSERMGVAHISGMTVQQPYSRDNDYELFVAGHGANHHFIRLDKGSFTIFLPQDVHMPCIQLDQPAAVKKVVIKVRLT